MKNYPYDAFLSFAVEDKIEVANELHYLLEQQGLKVWYSGRELSVGDDLNESIREGLDRSKYGIVIVSHNYFHTGWTWQELSMLLDKERNGHHVILPVLHKITIEDVGTHHPILAGRWSLDTREGLEIISDKLYKKIKQKKSIHLRKIIPEILRVLTGTRRPVYLLGASLLLIGFALAMFFTNTGSSLPEAVIHTSVQERMAAMEASVLQEMNFMENHANGKVIHKKEVMALQSQFSNLSSYYRNFYSFSNGFSEIQFLKNVSPASGVDFDHWSVDNNYGFKYPHIYLLEHSLKPPYFDKTILYFNSQSPTYRIGKIHLTDTLATVSVTYDEALRYVAFHYEFSPRTSDRKHTTYQLKGFRPREYYTFALRQDSWMLKHIE